MRSKFLFFILAFSCIGVFAQTTPDFGTEASHTFYIEQLSSAKDQNFQRILDQYNAYIETHPSSITAKVERCKFIGNAYWDEYEEYNLKEEETEECISSLYLQYPDVPEVVIYRAENRYGEAQLEALEKAENLIRAEEARWSGPQQASIYQMFAEAQEEQDARALAYYVKAQEKNDGLDLSLPIARIYKQQGKLGLAKRELLGRLEQDTMLWKMNQKATLLLELKEPETALYLFDRISETDSTYIDNSEMATVMSELGDLDLSREFLARDTVQEWNRVVKVQNLFVHDLEHSSPETALLTYRNLQKLDSNDDFFGVKRLMISFKNPFLSWRFSELFHFFLLFLSVIVVLIIPYLWVLPIYSLGGLLRKTNRTVVPKLHFNWGIRHFWAISFLYLLAQYAVLLVFDYQEYVNYYFDIGISYDGLDVENGLAPRMLFYIILMALSTVLVLKKDVLKHIYRTNMGMVRMVSLGIGFLIFNAILLKFLGRFVDLSEHTAPSVLLSAKAEIVSLMQTYGFGAAVILISLVVPLYEELIFRGVILGAVEKQTGFVFANIFQAVLFALIHFDLSLFLFYLIFGLITGHFVKRTKGLLTGIIFHAMNNFFVVVLLYYATRWAAIA